MPLNKIAILGGGESGTGSAILAKKKGFSVFLSDSGNIKPKYKQLLINHNIDFEEGKHTFSKIIDSDEVIKSPGIPDKSEIIKEIKNKSIPLISEIEFAARFTGAYKICITGSNGKTTTTMLTYDLLKRAGFNVGLAGNVGNSFALQVAENDFDYYVIELSSFQLDNMYKFKADIAILLNITPDHLDRYNYDINNYIDSKFRIIQNQDNKCFFIYCADDPIIMSRLQSIKSNPNLIPFSINTTLVKGAYIKENQLIVNYNTLYTMTLKELSLKGKHNIYNSMAAAITGNVLNIRKDTIRECLSEFQGVEHRLEPVLRIHGIEFINDSKATNVNSTWYALECMTTPVVWIAGGTDKGNDYSELIGLVKTKVKALVCLGVDNAKLKKAFAEYIPIIIETQSMKDAVKQAYQLARKGDTVLLSPACASFDLFENYEDRGRQFKMAVREL